MCRRTLIVFLVAGFCAVSIANAKGAENARAEDSTSACRETSCDPTADQACCCQTTPWEFEADVMWLQRTGGSGAPLGRTFDVASGNTIDTLASGDADYSMQAGTRFRLLMPRDECTAWEAVYFGMQTWGSGSSVTPDLNAGSLADSPWTQTDKLIGGFDTLLSFHTTSRLNNVEINRRRLLAANEGASLSWLCGVRYVQWDESLVLDGVNSLPAALEEIEVGCHNNMVGPQIGAEVRRVWDRWYLSVEGKAGLLGNAFQQHITNANSSGVQPGGFPAITPIDSGNRSSGVAGVFDLSAVATYQVTKHLSARGGYQLLWLCGLAQAPAQLGGFYHSGSVFLHGPTLGLELSW